MSLLPELSVFDEVGIRKRQQKRLDIYFCINILVPIRLLYSFYETSPGGGLVLRTSTPMQLMTPWGSCLGIRGLIS